MNRIPLLIRKHLDLNMPRPNNRLLENQLPVAKGALRLRPSPRQLIRQLPRLMHQPHPTPTTPGRRFDHHRIPNLLSSLLPRPRIRLRTLKPRHRRHPRLSHRLLRPPLTPHQLHGRSRRPDKDNPVVPTGRHKPRILRQKPIPRMHRISPVRRAASTIASTLR